MNRPGTLFKPSRPSRFTYDTHTCMNSDRNGHLVFDTDVANVQEKLLETPHVVKSMINNALLDQNLNGLPCAFRGLFTIQLPV